MDVPERPEELARNALKEWQNGHTDLVTTLASVIQAERERCARIAEMHDHRGDIAKAIRADPLASLGNYPLEIRNGES